MDDPDVLPVGGIRLGVQVPSRDAAIDLVGGLLVDAGAVAPGYVEAMHEREAIVSSMVGPGVAMPHGTDASRALVRRTMVAVVQLAAAIDWDGHPVRVVIGLASDSEAHLPLMARLAEVLQDPSRLARLSSTEEVEEVRQLLLGSPADADPAADPDAEAEVEVEAEAGTGPAGEPVDVVVDVAVEVCVGADVGLHARPAARVAAVAAAQDVAVTVGRPGRTPVDATSMLSLLTLGADRGDVVEVRATGPGARTAVEAVVAAIAAP